MLTTGMIVGVCAIGGGWIGGVGEKDPDGVYLVPPVNGSA